MYVHNDMRTLIIKVTGQVIRVCSVQEVKVW